MPLVIPGDLVRAVERFTECPINTPLHQRMIAYAHALRRASAYAAQDEHGIFRKQVTDRAVCVWTGLKIDPAIIAAAKSLATKLEKRYLH